MINNFPTSLQDAILYLHDYQNCHDFLVAMRWPQGVTCPRCGSADVTYMPSVRRWRCYR